MLLSLPLDILEPILQYCGVGQTDAPSAIRATCSGLNELCCDLVCRTLLHGPRRLQLAQMLQKSPAVAQYIGTPIPSPISLAQLLVSDWCFFGDTNIMTVHRDDISTVQQPEVVDGLMRGTWHVISDNPWGTSIYAANVLWLHVVYETALWPGRYWLTLNLRVRNLYALSPVRFRIINSDVVHTQFQNFVPLGVIDFGHTYFHDYLGFRPIDVCLGQVCVTGSGLAPVKFEVEEQGGLLTRGILFNYLYFENVVASPEPTSDRDTWFVRKPPRTPDLAMRAAYEEVTRHKLALVKQDFYDQSRQVVMQ